MTSTDASYLTRRSHERMSYQPHMDGDPSSWGSPNTMLVTNKTRLETIDMNKTEGMYTPVVDHQILISMNGECIAEARGI